MNIPAWVDKGKRSKSERCVARLKYVIGLLAAQHTSRGSARALAEKVGLNHSTVSIYVRRGKFSDQAAHTIVINLNDPTITVGMLTDPLSIAKAPG